MRHTADGAVSTVEARRWLRASASKLWS